MDEDWAKVLNQENSTPRNLRTEILDHDLAAILETCVGNGGGGCIGNHGRVGGFDNAQSVGGQACLLGQQVVELRAC